jgi:hypothetical protein
MAASPTGHTLAIGTRFPARITIWDPDAKQVLRAIETALPDAKQELRPHKPVAAELSVLAFSPTGEVLSSTTMSSDGLPCAQAWDPATGKKLYELPLANSIKRGAVPASPNSAVGNVGQNSWPSVVVFSPTGRTLAFAYQDGTVCLRDTVRPRRCCILGCHDAPVLALSFSPDGRMLASGGKDGTIRFWELATGGERCSLRGDDCPVTGVVFSRSGLRLASTGEDGTGLVWAVLDPPAARPRRGEGLDAVNMNRLWQDLLAADASHAYRAMRALLTDPDGTVRFLSAHVTPGAPWPGPALIHDLDSPNYRVRDRTVAELRKLGPLADRELEHALKHSLSTEVRRQAQRLLEGGDCRVRVPELLRAIRAIELLERIGTADARAVLVNLARSADPSPLADEARAATRRLQHRGEPTSSTKDHARN